MAPRLTRKQLCSAMGAPNYAIQWAISRYCPDLINQAAARAGRAGGAARARQIHEKTAEKTGNAVPRKILDQFPLGTPVEFRGRVWFTKSAPVTVGLEEYAVGICGLENLVRIADLTVVASIEHEDPLETGEADEE